MVQYETVIGLEVHVELATKTKIFCGCSTAFGAAPNTQVCPVCMGMPGALPVLNKRVVEHAIAVGLVTNCSITEHSYFDRKNYFYPDNPQNYQISQLYAPICTNGWVSIKTEQGEKTIGIHEIHMEEDAGKLVHDEVEGCSMVDYNRSGVPLIEIVSEPDMRSADEVIAYLEKLRMMIQYLGASDCKLQEGSMRADVNLSVRKRGENVLGTRTEMKNLNSFRAIRRAIAAESARQIECLEKGETIIQETRRWDDTMECSYPMRSKEDAKDYRYFPEPDLVKLHVEPEWISEMKSRQPLMREERIEQYMENFGISRYDAELITVSRQMAELFEQTTALCSQPKEVANWLMVEAMRLLKENGKEPVDIDMAPEKLSALVCLLQEGKINRTVAKEIFEHIFYEKIDPVLYVKEHGLEIVGDEELLKETVYKVFAENETLVADYHAGKERVMGYLVGQTMKALKGKADPAKVNQLVRELLAEGV